ncbi:hypothetical protein HK102_004582, partial [Quaeritorhiza haematococci]
DVARILGIVNVRDAIKGYDQDEKVGVVLTDGAPSPRVNFLTETGLYRLILASKKPFAKQFRKWVFAVAKEIRLTGQYQLQKEVIESKAKLIKFQEEKAAIEARVLQAKAKAKEEQKRREELKLKFQKRTFEPIQKTGHVYVIETDGGIKVGKTIKDVSSRIKGMQTGNRNDIRVLLDFKTSNPDILEPAVHYILDCYRCNSNREFFDCNIDHIKRVVILAGNTIDTLKSMCGNMSEAEFITRVNENINPNVSLESSAESDLQCTHGDRSPSLGPEGGEYQGSSESSADLQPRCTYDDRSAGGKKNPALQQGSNPFAKWLNGDEDDNRTPYGSVYIEEAPGGFECVSDLKKEFENYCRLQTPGKTKTPSWEKIYSEPLLKRGFRIERDVNDSQKDERSEWLSVQLIQSKQNVLVVSDPNKSAIQSLFYEFLPHVIFFLLLVVVLFVKLDSDLPDREVQVDAVDPNWILRHHVFTMENGHDLVDDHGFLSVELGVLIESKEAAGIDGDRRSLVAGQKQFEGPGSDSDELLVMTSPPDGGFINLADREVDALSKRLKKLGFHFTFFSHTNPLHCILKRDAWYLRTGIEELLDLCDVLMEQAEAKTEYFRTRAEAKTGQGGHNKETILLTPDTFKDLCMLADTAEGSEVREYFRTMENIVQNYTLMQNAFTTQRHQHQLEQQATKNRALQQQLQAKESELQKYVNKTYEEIETTVPASTQDPKPISDVVPITNPDGSLIDLKDYLARELTTEQQQLFIESAWMYLNRHEECCIDLEDAMQWMGVTGKDKQKKKLVDHFAEGADYIVYSATVAEINKGRGRPKETILLTPDAFKKLAQMSEGRGKEVREYFIAMERVVIKYMKMQNAFMTQQLLETRVQLEQQTRALEAKEDELQHFKSKKYEERQHTGFCYVIQTDGGIKVGKTKDIGKRVKGLQTANAKDLRILLAFSTSNPDIVERDVHFYLDRYRSNANREFFDCDPEYIKTVVELTGNFVNTMGSAYQAITRPKILEKLGEKFGTVFQLEAPSPEPVPQTTQASNPFAKWLDGGKDDNRTPNGSVFIKKFPGAFESVSDLKKEFESYCRSQTPGKTKTPSWEKVYSDPLLKRGFRIERDVNMCKSCNKPAKAGCCEEYSPQNRSKRHIVHNIRIVRKTNK